MGCRAGRSPCAPHPPDPLCPPGPPSSRRGPGSVPGSQPHAAAAGGCHEPAPPPAPCRGQVLCPFPGRLSAVWAELRGSDRLGTARLGAGQALPVFVCSVGTRGCGNLLPSSAFTSLKRGRRSTKLCTRLGLKGGGRRTYTPPTPLCKNEALWVFFVLFTKTLHRAAPSPALPSAPSDRALGPGGGWQRAAAPRL